MYGCVKSGFGNSVKSYLPPNIGPVISTSVGISHILLILQLYCVNGILMSEIFSNDPKLNKFYFSDLPYCSKE